MTGQRCYGGVRLLGTGPSLANVARLDQGAVPMICAMMHRGMRVDLSHFAAMEKTLTADMERIIEEIHDTTGYYINPGSGDQVADLLFKKLGLKQARLKMTKGGDRESVVNEVLVAVQHKHPVVSKLLDYKEFEKLLGTYVAPMPKLANRVAFGHWRMYPNLGQTRVPSGRLNCKNPNLLAFPTRTKRGKEIRKGFITDPGWVFLSVDESQIEVRVTAHDSEDPNLMAVYENEEDIYSDFATSAFKLEDKRYRDPEGWHYPGIDKDDHRFPAKTCVLASIYDVTAMGLLEQMPTICATCHKKATLHTCGNFVPLWDEDKCQDIINAFYLRYPGILHARRRNHMRARKHGLLWDWWGRILHVAAVRSSMEWVAAGALREAGNFSAQSTAQGTIKLTMAEVFDSLEAWDALGGIINPLLQVHDELVFEVREDFADEMGAYVSSVFEHCVRLKVPIKAAYATGENWGSIQK